MAPWTAPGDSVVVEAILFVPKWLRLAASAVLHGVTDHDEVLKELRSHVFVDATTLSKLQTDVQHVKAVETHPSCAVGLLQDTTSGQRIRSVENTNVVESQETTLKDVLSVGIFAVDPPCKI